MLHSSIAYEKCHIQAENMFSKALIYICSDGMAILPLRPISFYMEFISASIQGKS